jgi:hypothetical protein
MTDGSQLVAKALELLDTRFKEISSLKEIIVYIPCTEDPSDDLKQAMRDCGWVAEIVLYEDDDVEEDEELEDWQEDYIIQLRIRLRAELMPLILRCNNQARPPSHPPSQAS